MTHLVLTFSGGKLPARDPTLCDRMREISPVITSGTTMWQCWIGFNASHSMGALLIGLIYGYLALALYLAGYGISFAHGNGGERGFLAGPC